MAKILIVDDQPTSRQFLVTLLGYQNHRLLEARDGAEALELVRDEHPDLVISDILMPKMDGVEFARRLRAEPEIAATRVIFYTATYRVQEAEMLARSCGVAAVVSKPADPEVLLEIVRKSLGMTMEPAAVLPEALDRSEGHRIAVGGGRSSGPLGEYDPVTPVLQRAIQRVAELSGERGRPQEALAKLSEHLGELRTRVGHLYALLELSLDLTAERDPERMLKLFCAGVRRLLAAEIACAAILDRDEKLVLQVVTDGMKDPAALTGLRRLDGPLGGVLAERLPVRLTARQRERRLPNLPDGHPPVTSIIAVPLLSPSRLYGVVWFAGKNDAVTFTDEDETLAAALSAQLTMLYENLDFYGIVQRHSAELQLEIARRRQVEEDVRRLNRVYAVLSEVNSLIVRVKERQALFDAACRIAVEKGNFDLAWIGLLDEESGQLIPAAASGARPDDIELARVAARRYGSGEEGVVARAMRTRRAVVSNEIESDSAAMTRKETGARGLRSLAALPLAAGERCFGVLVLYSRTPGLFDEQEVRLLEELAGDISFAVDHIEKEERLNYVAYYDVLTGLPNRTLFCDRLDRTLEAAGAEQRPLAVFLIDVERIRNINESLGRHAGDAFLRQVATRLQSAWVEGTVARIGADSFAMKHARLAHTGEAVQVLRERIMACFDKPFRIEGHELRVACKAGIAVFPDDGKGAEELLTNAEVALRKAKAAGERYLFYGREMNARVSESLLLETRLRRALELGHFVLHYQPKVNASTRVLTGLEALIRWSDPEIGLVPPAHFIPMMEEIGLILEAGKWVLARAMSDFADWSARGLKPPRIAVNVATAQLQQKDFVEAIAVLLRDSGVGSAALELEITETMVMDNIEANISKLKALREMGVEIAIDDFGTGHSSLKYLARLPASALKIDRHFVSTATTDPNSMSLIATVISLAHSLKLKVVAEGVETEEQAKYLQLMRCDELQGYLIGKPLPLGEVEALLARD